MNMDELNNLAKSEEDPRLKGHATQLWGSEFEPHAITNANVISLVFISEI